MGNTVIEFVPSHFNQCYYDCFENLLHRISSVSPETISIKIFLIVLLAALMMDAPKPSPRVHYLLMHY